MSKSPDATHFEPYAQYAKAAAKVDDFIELSRIAYGLTHQLLVQYSPDQLPPSTFKPPDDPRESWTFSMADQVVEEATLTAGWVTYSDYADRECLDLDEVKRLASLGDLGRIETHPKSGEELILWPPSLHETTDQQLPSPGMNKYSVKVSVNAEIPGPELDPLNEGERENVRAEYLRLAHAIGEPAAAAEHASNMLHRAGILLHWTQFEAYLRSTMEALLLKHPQVLADARGKTALSLVDLVEFSDQLTSIDSLRERVIQTHIDKLREGGLSINGILNSLKSDFGFRDDPYSAWYVYEGKRQEVGYVELIELKDLRNILVHEGARQSGDDLTITEEMFARARLMLRSVAYSVARSISRGAYDIARK